MVYNRDEIVKRALASKTNDPGYCQMWTRTMCGAASAGDRDHDGDADAVDGWLSEPEKYRHVPSSKDGRSPPPGVPVAWSGGSRGNGHRAISLGNGKIRSTDAAGIGRVGTVDLEWVERTWGLTYKGWSETITGILIPLGPSQTPKPKTSRGVHIDEAIEHLRKARGAGERETLINRSLEALTALPKIR